MTDLHAIGVERLQALVRPRTIEGISANLLPYDTRGRPAWDAFAVCLAETASAGLTPAVNMDTGYVNLLTADERTQTLTVAAETLRGKRFVAGAFLAPDHDSAGSPGVTSLIDRYCRAADTIRTAGGTPIVFQCAALTALGDREVAAVYRGVAERSGPILGFELGTMFAPFGRIYSLDLFADLLQIPGLVGIKHSSLDRRLEWQRLALRDKIRPDFKLYTGNDLGIDMVMYGSDYLLGLSAFAPDAFALRDRLWAAGDGRFFELNDVLQYLGAFAFRPPVPAYKHSAAQFLHLRGRIPNPSAHPASPTRPESDVAVLREISARLDAAMARGSER
ncbi:MAG: dihydrodipicolinate synthase family protein [Chloroflexi bacterium]|nr:dihydrodipicolinate synthase family protein [Chloroflexota bacterium]